MVTVQEGIVLHLGDLQRFACFLVGSHRQADADDLVQNCVIRAIERANQFQEGTNLKAWLFTLMRNLFITSCRRDKLRRRHVESIAHSAATVSQPIQYHHVMLCQTARAMGTLDESDVDNLRELAIGELSHDAAAARYHVPIGTMKSRLSRSRGKLRRALCVGPEPIVSSLIA